MASWPRSPARPAHPLRERGEVLTSGTVRDLVAGSGIRFEDRGIHQLKACRTSGGSIGWPAELGPPYSALGYGALSALACIGTLAAARTSIGSYDRASGLEPVTTWANASEQEALPLLPRLTRGALLRDQFRRGLLASILVVWLS